MEKETFDISSLRLAQYSSNFNNSVLDNHRRLIAISETSSKIYEITKILRKTNKETNMFTSVFSKLKSFSSTSRGEVQPNKSNKYQIQVINNSHKKSSTHADMKHILDKIDTPQKNTARRIRNDPTMTDAQKQDLLKSLNTSPDAFELRMFVTNDNKKLIVIGTVPGLNACYNVFDLDKNEWLLPLNNHFDIFDIKSIAHSANRPRPHHSYAHSELLINDSFLIISFENMIYFYDLQLCTNLLKPVLIEQYQMQSEKVKDVNINNKSYWYHNMCLLSYNCNYSKMNKKMYYYISFLMIGGMHIAFADSLIKIDLQLSLNCNCKQQGKKKMKKFKKTQMEKKNGKFNKFSNYNNSNDINNNMDGCGYKITSIVENNLLNDSETLDLTETVHDLGNLNSFSCQIVQNMKGENIVIIIGGRKSGLVNPPDGFADSVFLFNLKTKKIVEKQHVFYKDYSTPYSLLKNDILCVCRNEKFYQICLKDLVDDYQGYGYSLSWKIERIIWIGYLKNNKINININVDHNEKECEKRQNDTKCLLSILPKDIIFHILQFCS